MYLLKTFIRDLSLKQGNRFSLDRHLEESAKMHLSLMCSLVTKQQHQITSLKSAISKLSLNYTGTLIWKITDYTAKMSEAKAKEGMELVSPPFYTSQYGYKLQVNTNLYHITNNHYIHDKNIRIFPITNTRLLEMIFNMVKIYSFHHDFESVEDKDKFNTLIN